MATGPLSARLRQLRYMVGLLRYDEPQTLTSAQRAQARANIAAADASTAALAARRVNAGTALTGGGALTGDVTINADRATQAETYDGASNEKLMTPLRVKQAVDRWAIGRGQTWQVPSRAIGSTYRNTTDAPIQVVLAFGTNENGAAYVGATTSSMVKIYENPDWDRVPFSFIVPPDHYYRATGGSLFSWTELR